MRTVLRKLIGIDARMKLRDKILISFVLIVLIPSSFIGYFSYKKSSSIIQEQTSHAYLEALRQTAINISYRLNEVENISEIIYTNEKLQQILRRARGDELTIADIIDDYKSITEIIRNLEKSRNIFRIRLLVPNSPLYAAENQNIFGLSQNQFQQLGDQLSLSPGLMEWRYFASMSYMGVGQGIVQKSVVSLYRLMKDFNDVNMNLGAVAIDIDETTLQSVIRDMSLALPYHALLYKNSQLITAYSNSQGSINIDSRALDEVLEHQASGGSGIAPVRFQGKNYLYLVRELEQPGWKLIVLVPTVGLTDQSKLVGPFILILTGTLIAIAILLSILLSNMITKRLNILAGKMKGIEQGHFGELVEISGNDEISLLQRRFNKMSTEIKGLIDEVYTITINKQREELKVLEGRINSHFLYNTLDTIKWLAFKSKAPDIAQVVTNLSKFFRISLNRGNDTITVDKELEHVKAYIDIQNIRFAGRFRHDIAVDPTLLQTEVIKLILQPIVENAIIHGVNKQPAKQGSVTVRGRRQGPFIDFYVFDDGIGMSREAAGALLKPGAGYGLLNVHQRLQLYYGPECGVKIRSKPGAGTAVRLRLLIAAETGEREATA
ncbi:sensor histidine kinase [Paenibacillus thalictri]|uniref:histidine kinase n=1 Tax=Paenibacillus thalictri TaxID=2527873 RepID=A0A4Q9DJI5_9BACL|nr:sensor histidine kinase [Paenibacillus thalictri]TBL74557.1 sensor histidine kinase [Paenibacillus thalictri]